MALPTPSDLEILWDSLLSRQPALICAVFDGLPDEDQQAVMAHLWRMANEEGWHPEQRKSAEAALQALLP